MGFYGNVFYQLANSFGKFIIKNNGLIKEDFGGNILPEDMTTTSAIGLDATYNFDTGNKWIRLLAQPGSSDTLLIYHSPIQDTSNSNNIVPLTHVEASNFPEGQTAVEMVAGDYISIPSIVYDAAGHVIKTSDPIYFKLPITDVEADMQDLQNRMVIVEASDQTQNTDINKLKTANETLNTRTSFIGEKSDFSTQTQQNYTLTQMLGSYDNLLSKYRLSDSPSDKDFEWGRNTAKNISNALLDLDVRVKKNKSDFAVIGADLDSLNAGDSTTVISAINNTYALASDISNSYHTLNKQVSDLIDRVKALEDAYQS